MKWSVTLAVGPVDESAVAMLISHLPPETLAAFVGREEMHLSVVKFKVEAPTEAKASELGFEILKTAAAATGLSVAAVVRRVDKAAEP